MSKENNGGPAFPFWSDTQHLAGYEGMSLRDYFAAKALACWHLGRCTEEYHEHAAVQAYAIADAMLKAREA